MEAQLSKSTPYVNLNPHYRGRVRSGCLTCRDKKVKCDEQHPTCKRCARLKKECLYPSRGIRAVHDAPPQREQDLGRQTQSDPVAGPSALSLMTSQDIHLCTTIDWLAANARLEAVSFSYFLDEVNLPLLTPVDPLGWTQMKAYAVDLADRHKSVAAAISAVQLLWSAHTYSLPTTNAISRYHVAKEILEANLDEDAEEFNIILLTAFLLSLFSIILLDGAHCIFAHPSHNFTQKLKLWSHTGLRKPMVSRIAAWLHIVHAAARRGGNPGILSEEVYDVLSDQYGELPSLAALSHRTPDPYDSASSVSLKFYLSLQGLSLRVANLSHYHRSRITAADQEEVVRLMECLRADLRSLWLTRPAIMRCDPSDVRSEFSTSAADILIDQAAISMASYYAEHVDIDRSLGDPLSVTAEAEESFRQIEHLVERALLVRGRPSPGLLRPLFMYAIEHENSSKAQWAICRMKEIKDPMARSDFFASYAQALAEEQRIRKRRVTTRWFCYERYGVSPPFL